ncbi:MAG TPA: thiamine pyrophosphate-dependent dehydrogenase E1 component subunit alpha [Candidatus Baltobacteraceae bacterium]|nr:thiamine pyrophosphate-dependent dehydrogenase E1 component subunit alpha [Candidatus Baltobacteraceae bacterium]
MTRRLDTGTADELLYYYRAMLRIRMVEEAIADRYSEQKMRCPTHLSIGQEAVAVGVCAALELRDYVVSTHRPHAHYLAKGGSLPAMIAELYGKATGCCGGRGGSMHLIDLAVNMLGSTPIVGGSVPIAVGAAFGSSMRGEDRVTVVFFGDGMTEEGVFLEALNFAALKNLPIVFVCENNYFSVYSPLSVRQATGRSRVGIATASGLQTGTAHGNDVSAVAALASDAIARARGGGGPAYLEFDTYRWREHCGPNYDNDLAYRSLEEFAEWQTRCPITTLQRELVRGNDIDQNEIDRLSRQIQEEIDSAFAFAESSPDPDTSLLTRVFADGGE